MPDADPDPSGDWPAPRAPGPLDAVVRLPGSKSLTNRYLILAALADDSSRIRAPLRSRDTLLMAGALRSLGTQITDEEPERYAVAASGGGAADWVVTPQQLRGGASLD